MRRTVRMALAVGLLVSVPGFAGLARGQGADAALRDRVGQLVERLDSPKREARDAAEKALMELGPRALPFLPEASPTGSADRNQRLDRIRQALRETQDQAGPGPSMVTLVGKGVRLTEAIRQLERQSGNVISDVREQYGGEVTNPALDLEIQNRPFLEALDLLATRAGLETSFYTGDGSVGLMPGGVRFDPALEGDGEGGDRPNPFLLYSGPFRVVLRHIQARRDFQVGLDQAEAQFEVDWEPRLRPLLLSLKAEDIEIVDDRGLPVEPDVAQASTSVPLQSENPTAELNLRMTAPDRAARSLAWLKVKADLTVPAAFRTFRFPSLTGRNVQQKQGDVSVLLESTEADGPVWKVNVTIILPDQGPTLESFQQGLLNNRLWLQRADGSRFEHNGGFNNTAVDNGRISFQYLFVDAPGQPADYQLVYETPGKLVTLPLEFEFKDVPLP